MNVPWSIDPATPFIKLIACENEDAFVECAVDFGPLLSQQKTTPERIPENNRSVLAVSTSDVAGSITEAMTDYQLIEITFEWGMWTKMSPSSSNFQATLGSEFDMSRFKILYSIGEDGVSYLARFNDIWLQNGICPNPNFYEIEGSPWVEATNASRWGGRHFLLVGHDAYIEIIAKDWKWKRRSYINW